MLFKRPIGHQPHWFVWFSWRKDCKLIIMSTVKEDMEQPLCVSYTLRERTLFLFLFDLVACCCCFTLCGTSEGVFTRWYLPAVLAALLPCVVRGSGFPPSRRAAVEWTAWRTQLSWSWSFCCSRLDIGSVHLSNGNWSFILVGEWPFPFSDHHTSFVLVCVSALWLGESSRVIRWLPLFFISFASFEAAAMFRCRGACVSTPEGLSQQVIRKHQFKTLNTSCHDAQLTEILTPKLFLGSASCFVYHCDLCPSLTLELTVVWCLQCLMWDSVFFSVALLHVSPRGSSVWLVLV